MQNHMEILTTPNFMLDMSIGFSCTKPLVNALQSFYLNKAGSIFQLIRNYCKT